MKLKDKVAIITGSGAGIGKGIALEFAKEGAKVVVNVSRNIDAGNEVVDEIEKLGGEAILVKADVTKTEDIKNLVAEAIKSFGKIDILVNNAGMSQNPTPVADMSEDEWQKIIGLNLTAPFLMSKYTIPEILKSGGGAIINLGSIASFEAGSGAGYVVSKHGIIGLTKEIAVEYGRQGINCNAICPGAIESNMTIGMFDEGSPAAPLLQKTPAKRLGKASEIGRLAVFLASEDGKFIHGASYLIDGGWTLV